MSDVSRKDKGEPEQRTTGNQSLSFTRKSFYLFCFVLFVCLFVCFALFFVIFFSPSEL